MDEKIKEIENLYGKGKNHHIETLISYIKELEGAIRGWRIVEMVDKKRIKELKDGIEKVLKWRNLDGDGISDPLRMELYGLITREEE